MRMNRRGALRYGIAGSLLAVVGCSNDINLDNLNKNIKSLGLNDNSKRGYKTLEELAQESITEIEPLRDKLRNRLIEVKNPIKISSYEDFQRIGRDQEYPLTANYILTQDIDCKGSKLEQIGDKENPFSGTFNGNHYEISNFVLGDYFRNGVALFDSTTKDAIIANLKLKSGKVIGNRYVSVLVGINDGNIFNCCFASGLVNGNYQVGGFIGRNSGNVIDCYIGENVKIDGTGTRIFIDDVTEALRGKLTGGLTVKNFRGNIINSYTLGNIIGHSQVGGIASMTNEGVIRECFSDGKIKGNLDIGGVVGYSSVSVLIYCKENSKAEFISTQPPVRVSGISPGPRGKGTLIGYGHNSAIIYQGRKNKEWVGHADNVRFIER